MEQTQAPIESPVDQEGGMEVREMLLEQPASPIIQGVYNLLHASLLRKSQLPLGGGFNSWFEKYGMQAVASVFSEEDAFEEAKLNLIIGDRISIDEIRPLPWSAMLFEPKETHLESSSTLQLVIQYTGIFDENVVTMTRHYGRPPNVEHNYVYGKAIVEAVADLRRFFMGLSWPDDALWQAYAGEEVDMEEIAQPVRPPLPEVPADVLAQLPKDEQA